ncbi:FadR/GntR family transcriptional regulator [Nocardia sp. A7]|uniref:FadR/GntR family transcriptional regulator n=1 Tax=Nocardia sp. A7 TaxID=2789274 RepID=UPI00397BC591
MVNGVQTRAEALAANIAQMIIERGLSAGDWVGTMDELREQTGFARSTVSEAVRLLADRGSIDIRPGRGGGLFVANLSPVVRLRHTLLTVREQPTTVADAIAVRDALELLVDTDAARHRDADDIVALRTLLSKLKQSTSDVDAFMRANWQLHERIAQITTNHMARAVYLSMTACIKDLSAHADPETPTDDAGYYQHRVAIHSELVESIIAGDTERTVKAVEKHHGLLKI